MHKIVPRHLKFEVNRDPDGSEAKIGHITGLWSWGLFEWPREFLIFGSVVVSRRMYTTYNYYYQMLRSFLRLKMRGLEIPEEVESMRAPISPSTFLAFAHKRAQQTNKTGKAMARFLKLREKLADPSMIFMENNTIANGRSSFKM